MKPVLAVALAAALAAASGCARYDEVYDISFRNISGLELASGTVAISGPLPVIGMTRGWYKLQLRRVPTASKETEIFFQLFTGKESGRVEWTVGAPRAGVSSCTFDFMPGFVDATIVAHASPTVKGHWRGRWAYALFPGGREGGSFEVAREPGAGAPDGRPRP